MRSGEVLQTAMWGGRTPALVGVAGAVAAVVLAHPQWPEPLYQPGATVPSVESCDQPVIFTGDPNSEAGQTHARRVETSRALCRAALATAAEVLDDMDRDKRGPNVRNSYANAVSGNTLMLTERVGAPGGEKVVRVLYSKNDQNGPNDATYQPRWVRSWPAKASPGAGLGLVLSFSAETGWQAQAPALTAGGPERWIPDANASSQQAEADQQAAVGFIARLPTVS